MGSFTCTGTTMSYNPYASAAVKRAAEDGSFLDEFNRLFFSNSDLTVNLYPVLIFGASVGLVLLLTFLMSTDSSYSARAEQGYAAAAGQQPLQESDQGFNGATGLPLALAGYGYIVPVNTGYLNQNSYKSVNQPFVNVGYTS